MQIRIEKLVHGGSGMGRYDGKTVFVPYSAPGDLVGVKIVLDKKSYSEAEIINVLDPSGDRVRPQCAYFGECGGCHLQHMTYASQLLWKQMILEEQLERIAKIKDSPVLPTIPSPHPWGYRSRVQLHFENGKIGFHRRGTNDVVDVGFCAIASGEVNEILTHVRADWPKKEKRLEIGNSGGSFAQVNPCINDILKKEVAMLAGKAKSATDFYAGSGNLSFALAGEVVTVTAVEHDKTAAFRGEEFARANGIKNVNFVASRVEDYLKVPQKAELVLADPPREGLGGQIVSGIVKCAPKKIIYVSCDPATLARDIKEFMESGYSLVQCQPIDMFPQTYHIESISFLKKV